MPTVADYIIKLSISLAIVFLFYRFVLSNLTFYKWNRWYLLAYTILCFFIPFVDIMPAMPQTNEGSNTIINMIPALQPHIQIIAPSLATEASGWSLKNILFVIIAIVSAVLLLRLIIQFISLRLTINKARLISNDKVKLYYVDKDIMPFSFGNSIFINPQLHNADELQEIIRHEFVHVKQKHSIDVLWAEVLCIINWFNPFVWLIRNAVRQNLEFIADNKVLQNGTDKTQYQYLLLKVLGNHQFAVASPFNFSSLKKRIFMMNKMRTAKIHLLKFLFLLPMLVIILLAFRSGADRVNESNIFIVAGIVVDHETLKPVEGVIIGDIVSGVQAVSDKKGYYILNVPILRKDTLQIVFSYTKTGYFGSREMAAFRTTNPVEESNLILILGMEKDNTDMYMYGYGPAKKYNRIVSPDYELVYAKYIDLLDNKKKEAQIGESTKPIYINSGIPYAVGNGSIAWFKQDEVDKSPECKVWADGKIMTIEEANNKFNRFELKGVGAVPRDEAKKIFGTDCNILLLMKDSSSPIKPAAEIKSKDESSLTTAYLVAPFLILNRKTMELQSEGQFSGIFIGKHNDTIKATSGSGFAYQLNSNDVVTFNGEDMKSDKIYTSLPLHQFKITSTNFNNSKSVNISLTPQLRTVLTKLTN